MSSVDQTFDSLSVGQSAEDVHLVTQSDLERFASVSGDMNPLHTDSVYAAQTEFKAPIVHGMFLGALMSRFIGMILPGTYSLLMAEELKFRRPVHVGDEIRVHGAIEQKSEATRIVILALRFMVGNECVADGRAHVRVIEPTLV